MEEAVVVVREISWANVLKARDHISMYFQVGSYLELLGTRAQKNLALLGDCIGSAPVYKFWEAVGQMSVWVSGEDNEPLSAP